VANQGVVIPTKIDTKEILKAIGVLNKLKLEFGATGKAADKTSDKFKNQNKTLKNTNSGLVTLEGQLKQTANRINIMGVGVGNISAAFSGAVGAVRSMTSASNALSLAMKAIPIVALLAALTTLVALFTRSEEGQNKLKKITTQLTVLFGIFADRAAILGEMLFNAFAGAQASWLVFRKDLVETGEEVMSILTLIGETARLAFSQGVFDPAQQAQIAENFLRIEQQSKALFSKMKEGAEDFNIEWEKLVNEVRKIALGDLMKEINSKLAEAAELADEEAAAVKLTRFTMVEIAKLQGEINKLRLRARQQETASFKEQLALQNTFRENEIIASAERVIAILNANGLEMQNKEAIAEQNKIIIEQEQRILQNRIAAARLQSADLTDSIRSREMALEKTLEQEDLAIALIETDIANLVKRLRLNKDDIADKLALAELQTQLGKAEASRASALGVNQRSINTLIRRRQTFELQILKLKEEQNILTEDEATRLAEIEETIAKRAKEQRIKDAIEVGNALLSIRQAGIQNEIASLERQMAAELAMAGDNANKKAEIEKKFQKKINAQKKKAWETDQIAAVSGIAINTALGIGKTLENLGLPAAIPFMALAAALGAIQLGTILAQKPPNFGKGGPIDGPMHAQGGVHINAEGGEFMLQRSAVAQLGLPYLKALNEGKVGTDGGNATEYDKFIKALQSQTQNYNIWDERGFSNYQRKRNAIVQRKAIRYSVNG